MTHLPRNIPVVERSPFLLLLSIFIAQAGCQTETIHYDAVETEEIGRGSGPDLIDLNIQPEDCTDEDGDGYGDGCALGYDCNDSSASVYPGAAELCDQIDNNCDELVDEGCPCTDGVLQSCYTGSEESLGVGRCHAGWQICSLGEWGPCISEIIPVEEVCDQLDNDCDGITDEGLTNICGTCGVQPDEVCGDGLDNDCDGAIDETEAGCDCEERLGQVCYSGAPQTLGVGLCRGGTFDCEGIEWGVCQGEVLPHLEVCDGLDNDCDGMIDEEITNACGVCGEEVPVEVCDGLDNDCDGLTDEGLILLCGLCSAEGLEEVCGDGLDNDCDGDVDEVCACEGEEGCYPGPPHTRGVGACVDGTRTCNSTGEFWTECADYVLPQPEVCDGIDNDCDGFIDLTPDGCDLCMRNVEECDGLDNDCDGLVDEFLTNSCGQCIEDVITEEECGAICCDGFDNDCDGWIDETLINACGTCGDSCYLDIWDTGGSLSEGQLDGLEEDVSGGLKLGSSTYLYPFLWVANSGENTVSRINTLEPSQPVYSVAVGTDPSRTAVDLDGNVWVANRAFGGQGSVTKILAENESGLPEALFTIDVGNPGDIARGLAVDADNHVWVGTYEGRSLYQLEPDSGTIISSTYVGVQIYGLAIDSNQTLWMSSLGDAVLGRFNTATMEMEGTFAPTDGSCFQPYGIAVDGFGHVWLGNWTCNTLMEFDPDITTFINHVPPGGDLVSIRGVAVDNAARIWMAATDSNRVGRYDSVSDSWLTLASCSGPMGIGIAGGGTVWSPCWDSQVFYYNGDGDYLGTSVAGSNPYSYSDMTGYQLRTFTAQLGTWRVVFDCGWEECTFDEVLWNATEMPPGSSVQVKVRSSFDLDSWSEWSGPYETSPAFLAGLVSGRYAEIELQLSAGEDSASPVVNSVEINWQRP